MSEKETERQRNYMRVWRAENPDKEAGYRKKRKRDRSPVTIRASNLRRLYGMSTSEWEAMFVSQDCACACCGTRDPNHKSGWMTDHNHFTNRVRGIVCPPCNHLLTKHLSFERLRQLRAYLTRTDGPEHIA